MAPAKKNDRVAPPAEPGNWQLRFGTTEAAKGWEELCRQAPGNTRKAWEAIGAEPAPFPATGRHHRLKGSLASRGELEQWQYEVTGSGRIWYVIDEAKKTVFLVAAGTGHPQCTD